MHESRGLGDVYKRQMQGDASLFARADEIELAWGLIDPILAEWGQPGALPPAIYEPGSWGPVEADDSMARDGRTWLYGCGEHEA